MRVRRSIFRLIATRRFNCNLRLTQSSSPQASIVRQCGSGRRATVGKERPSDWSPSRCLLPRLLTTAHECQFYYAIQAPLPPYALVRTAASLPSPTIPQSMYSRFKLARSACWEASATSRLSPLTRQGDFCSLLEAIMIFAFGICSRTRLKRAWSDRWEAPPPSSQLEPMAQLRRTRLPTAKGSYGMSPTARCWLQLRLYLRVKDGLPSRRTGCSRPAKAHGDMLHGAYRKPQARLYRSNDFTRD